MVAKATALRGTIETIVLHPCRELGGGFSGGDRDAGGGGCCSFGFAVVRVGDALRCWFPVPVFIARVGRPSGVIRPRARANHVAVVPRFRRPGRSINERCFREVFQYGLLAGAESPSVILAIVSLVAAMPLDASRNSGRPVLDQRVASFCRVR